MTYVINGYSSEESFNYIWLYFPPHFDFGKSPPSPPQKELITLTI